MYMQWRNNIKIGTKQELMAVKTVDFGIYLAEEGDKEG